AVAEQLEGEAAQTVVVRPHQCGEGAAIALLRAPEQLVLDPLVRGRVDGHVLSTVAGPESFPHVRVTSGAACGPRPSAERCCWRAVRSAARQSAPPVRRRRGRRPPPHRSAVVLRALALLRLV